MRHPFIRNPKLLLLYSIVWIAVAIAQYFILLRTYAVPNVGLLVIDSLFSSVLFAVIGMGIWFVILFGYNEKRSVLSSFAYHAVALVLMVMFWIFAGSQIYNIFAPEEIDFGYKQMVPAKAIIGVINYVLLAFFYYIYYYYQRLTEKTKEEAKLRQLVTETQLNALKNQINPHFLFNSLNSVSFLTISEPEKAQDMVIKLSTFLRYSLKHREGELVPLSQEVDHIRLYLDIEKVRFGEKLITEFNVKECEHCQIPNMILQPLYENAIKYGVYETTGQVIIKTESKKVDNKLVLTISNNYDPDAVVKKGEGIGIKNIRRRLGLLFGDTTLLYIKNENHIFEVTLTIPQK